MRQTCIDLRERHGSVITVNYRSYHESTVNELIGRRSSASTANGQTPRYRPSQCSVISYYLHIYGACYLSSASVGMEISRDVIE